MFSANIQNLINTSGREAAMARAAQLQMQVNNYSQQPTVAPSPVVQTSEFNKVLSESADSAYRFREVNPGKRVFGTLVKPSAIKNVSPLTEDEFMAAPPSEIKHLSKSKILDIISSVSDRHGVSEKLIKALVKQESGFNPKAVSKAGARGLMQLMPGTAKTLGVKDSFNPVENVDGGVRYLKSMIDKYNGNVILALAAYNAGPGAVDKYKGVPPYKETQNYVKNILADYLG